jgi:hypothetical protein
LSMECGYVRFFVVLEVLPLTLFRRLENAMGVTPQDSIRSHYILYTKHPRMLISMPVFHTMSHTNVFNQLDSMILMRTPHGVSEPGRRAQRRIRYHPELSCAKSHKSGQESDALYGLPSSDGCNGVSKI